MAFLSKYMSIGKCVSLDDKQLIPVQNNLALTPSKMAEFVDQGIPVSASQLNGDFFDGVSNPSWDVSIDLKRGVDVAEVWQAQKTARFNITSNVQTKD